MTGRHVFYEGHVQGVGFRYTVRQLAKGYDVTGWVRNLPDGRVELLAGGEPEEVNAFLQAIAESELESLIRHVQSGPAEADALAEAGGFHIRN